MRTILVTGAAGYIGLHTTLELLDHGYKVIGLDDLSNNPEPPELENFKFYKGDIGDQSFVRDVLRENAELDGIIHFAGSIYVGQSMKNPGFYYHNNLINSIAFLEVCSGSGMWPFIFSSSAGVYGEAQTDLITEDHPKNPMNPYGRTKLAFEWVLEDMARVSDLRYVALRYFNAAGADPKGRAGQSTKGNFHLIKAACQVATGKRDKLVIFGDDYDTPDGTCVRDYIHVTDLAIAHRLSLEYLLDKDGKSVALNCGYGKGYSVREIATTMQKISGNDFTTDVLPRRPGDAAKLVSANDKIKDILGWAPQYDDIEEILRSALAWEQKLPY